MTTRAGQGGFSKRRFVRNLILLVVWITLTVLSVVWLNSPFAAACYAFVAGMALMELEDEWDKPR